MASRLARCDTTGLQTGKSAQPIKDLAHTTSKAVFFGGYLCPSHTWDVEHVAWLQHELDGMCQSRLEEGKLVKIRVLDVHDG